MKGNKVILLGLKISVFIMTVPAFYACTPRVEDVTYAEYPAHFKNELSIIVNTHRGLFEGRESFLHFKRDIYEFSFETRSKIHTEQDIGIFILPGHIDVKPRLATIRILEDPPDGIVVIVEIDDQKIPKLINGKYRLRLSSDNYVRKDKDKEAREYWYKLK